MGESNLQDGKLVGIEVSASLLKAVRLDSSGALVDEYIRDVNVNASFADGLNGFIEELKSRFGSFEKAGIAVPGLLSRKTKRVAFSVHIPEQAEIDLAEEIKKSTGVSITIENDANAAAYGEYLLGAGRGSRDLFYTTLGRGVGGAFIFSGEIWRGTSGFAGEFGHITIDSEGTKLEDVASSANIIRRVRGRVHQDSASSLRNVSEDALKIADLINAANDGDGFSQMMLERTGNYVGTGVASVINLLNIERVVIGGDVMEAGNWVLDAIINRARELSFAPCFESVEILKGELDGLAAAMGIALLSAEN